MSGKFVGWNNPSPYRRSLAELRQQQEHLALALSHTLAAIDMVLARAAAPEWHGMRDLSIGDVEHLSTVLESGQSVLSEWKVTVRNS